MLARLVTLLLLLSAPVLAETVAIRAGHLVDPTTGLVTDDQIVLVREGKIVEVGPSVKITEGAEVVDLSNAWVFPGLMDAHTHLAMGLPPAPPGESLWEIYLLKESTAFRTARAIHHARVLLEGGFTTVRDIGNEGNFAMTAVRQAQAKGWVSGPTIFSVGKIIAPFGGQSYRIAPEQGPFWHYEYFDADTPDEIRKAVRQNIYYGANAIKMVADNSAFHYSEEEIRAGVEEAHGAGLTVGVHVYVDDAARSVILGGADSIEHGFRLSDEVLELMKEKGTVLVGTDFPYEHLMQAGQTLPRDEKETANTILDRLRRAHRVGVKMAFGTDVVVDTPGRTRLDKMLDYLDVWITAGIPAPKILKCMTTNVAELLWIDDERGAVKAGFAADIVATPVNPLENIHTLRDVHFVMKDGEVIKYSQ